MKKIIIILMYCIAIQFNATAQITPALTKTKDSMVKANMEMIAQQEKDAKNKLETDARKENEKRMAVYYASDAFKKESSKRDSLRKDLDLSLAIIAKKQEDSIQAISKKALLENEQNDEAYKKAKLARLAEIEKANQSKEKTKITLEKAENKITVSNKGNTLYKEENNINKDYIIENEKKKQKLNKMLNPNDQDVIEMTNENKKLAKKIVNKKYQIALYRDQPLLNNDNVVLEFRENNELYLFFNDSKVVSNYAFPSHQFKMILGRLITNNGEPVESEVLQSLGFISFLESNENGNLSMKDNTGVTIFELKEKN